MSLRSYMNNNPAIVTVAAIVVLLVCLGLIYQNLAGSGATYSEMDVWYYDLNTNELFVTSSESRPPIVTESGGEQPAGVRAFVFACEEEGCDDPQRRQVAYLEKYTDEAKAALEAPDDSRGYEQFEMMERGRLVKTPEMNQWVPAMSGPGSRLTERIGRMCPSGYPQPCFPGR